MADVGRPGLPWQRDALNDALGVREDGRWAAFEVAIWLSRQNGKGWITEALELFGAYMLREPLIIHSAHLFDTSQKAFNRTIEIVENSDWLRKRTAKILRGKGFEAIKLLPQYGGGSIEFKARTLHGSRGLTGPRVTLDEAYALTTGHYQAMSPVMATLPNPQIVYTSSPPDETTGMMPVDALAPSIRRRGIKGDPRLAMLSWEPPAGKYDPGDVDLWYECNPSLGDEAAVAAGLALIDEEFLRSQWGVFSESPRPMAFATEHLGAWPPDGAQQWAVISSEDWQAAGDPELPSPEQRALAVTVAPDQSMSYICAAGPVGVNADGKPVFGVAILDARPGVSWVLERLVERYAAMSPVAVAMDRNSAAEQVWLQAEAHNANAAWDATKVETLASITPRDECAASMAFARGICGLPGTDDTGVELEPRTVKHRAQKELDDAVAGAIKKQSGSMWRWDELGPVDLSALKGVSEALHAYLLRQPPTETPWVWDGAS